MNEDELQKSMDALGKYLIQKGDKEGLALYQRVLNDLAAGQKEMVNLIRQVKTVGEAVG